MKSLSGESGGNPSFNFICKAKTESEWMPLLQNVNSYPQSFTIFWNKDSMESSLWYHIKLYTHSFIYICVRVCVYIYTYIHAYTHIHREGGKNEIFK